MANFTPSQKSAEDFNNGVEYVDGDIENGIMGDAVQAETINNVIESQLWTQALATNPVDNTEADNVGTPSIEIATMPDGTPRLKAKNLKGKTGKGISSITPNGTDANGGNVYNVNYTEGSPDQITAPKGATGDTGNGVSSAVTTYATSTSGVTAPSSGWQSTIPAVAKGSYLWTRTVTTYTYGTSNTSYAVAYQGKDGTGSVTSVNGQTGTVNLTANDITPFVTCSTSASTVAKTVSIEGFVLTAGARVSIKFTYANTVNSPTLNVNSTGAKSIKADGDTTYVKWLVGAVMEFVYDGTNWVVISGYALQGMRVGEVITRHDSTSPATLYGGSWASMEARFILPYGVTNNPLYKSSYDSATQYYKDEIVSYNSAYWLCVKNSKGNMPATSSNYWVKYEVGCQGGEAYHTLTIDELPPHNHELLLINYASGSDMVVNSGGTRNARGGDSIMTLNTGGGLAHNNMSLYQVEYAWRRTA